MSRAAPGHPHAWDVQRAAEHLEAGYRRKNIAKGGELIVTAQMDQLIASIPAALDRRWSRSHRSEHIG